jgi:pimeloyl-ACP methyl ester carboxylesterase
MKYTVQGHDLYAYNGGKAHREGQPTIVFIHGVLNDHSVWILQSRYLAHHGWNVLAIDLPGHGKSDGPCPRSVEEAADVIRDLLDAAGVQKAALIGHSWGSLIALETAARLGERITHLGLVGIAYPMRVSDALLDASVNAPQKGIHMVYQFSWSTLGPPPSALGPGTWVHGASVALSRRLLASNTRENIFHLGFLACDSYRGGEAAMAKVAASGCKVLFALGQRDQMTPPKACAALRAIAPHATVALMDVGHMQMTESPEALLAHMQDWLR